MPLEPKTYICNGRLLAIENAEDVDPATYFAMGGEVPDQCPNCSQNLHGLQQSLPNRHRNNVNCPNCGFAVLQQRFTCNWDLTPIFEVMPYDGQNYLITCPNCGNISRAQWPAGVDYGPPSDPPEGYDPNDYVQPYTI